MTFDVEKLRAGTPKIGTINGKALYNQCTDPSETKGEYPTPDVNKLHPASTQVSAINGFVRNNKGC